MAIVIAEEEADATFEEWVGLEWRHIGADMVLRDRPTKTGETSGPDVVIDLSICPMVLEEIARIPPEARVGPMEIHDRHRQPYGRQESTDPWKKVRTDAGIRKPSGAETDA